MPKKKVEKKEDEKPLAFCTCGTAWALKPTDHLVNCDLYPRG